MNNKEGKYIFFALSPIISIPLIFQGIYNKSKGSLILLALLFGLLSFLFIPKFGDDKGYYYYLYGEFKHITFKEFLFFVNEEKTDFIFYGIILFFSKANIPLSYMFLVLTFVTINVWFSVFEKVVDSSRISKREYLIAFLLVFFSFSLPGLFSGVRFYLAVSLVLLGFYNGVLEKKKLKGLILIIIASLTHFSCIFFIPFYFLVTNFPDKFNWYRNIFIASFVFFFIPRETLFHFTSNIELSDVYKEKTVGYLGETDYIENSLSVGNFNNFIKYFFKSFWTYIAYIYIIITWKHKSIVRNVFFVCLALSNIFYSAPTIYNRYLIVAQAFFLLTLLTDYIEGVRSRKILFSLLITLSLNFFGNAFAMRDVFLRSYGNVHSFTLITTFLKDEIDLKDFKEEEE